MRAIDNAQAKPLRTYSRECHEDISMKNEEIELLLLRGVIASMPPEQQQVINECAQAIKQAMSNYPEGERLIALSLTVAELTQD